LDKFYLVVVKIVQIKMIT